MVLLQIERFARLVDVLHHAAHVVTTTHCATPLKPGLKVDEVLADDCQEVAQKHARQHLVVVDDLLPLLLAELRLLEDLLRGRLSRRFRERGAGIRAIQHESRRVDDFLLLLRGATLGIVNRDRALLLQHLVVLRALDETALHRDVQVSELALMIVEIEHEEAIAALEHAVQTGQHATK